ncbi:MAG: glycosyltransferase family 2 protein [Candidatus Dormibacteria bacterium]
MLVTWNAAVMLPACLASLRAQDLPVDLVVVDNASSDGSLELVLRAWPSASVRRLDHNTGFAAAANVGAGMATTDYVALLNYDVVLDPGYLSSCVAALDSNPGAGSAQGLLLRPGRLLLDSAGHTVSRGRWVRNRGENQPLGSPAAWAPASVFGVTGAAAVYRRAMLEEVSSVTGHLFDPAFFAYLEDVDLDHRAAWLGWSALVVEGAVAEHVHSGSGARGSTLLQRHIIKNRLLVLYRNEDLGNLLRDLPWIAMLLSARLVVALLQYPGSLAGVADFYRLRRQQRGTRRAIMASRRVSAASMRAWYSDRTPLSSRTRGLPGEVPGG